VSYEAAFAEVPTRARGLERRYAEFRQAWSIVTLIAGPSYPELNLMAARLATRI
jgi:hypothetical protein